MKKTKVDRRNKTLSLEQNIAFHKLADVNHHKRITLQVGDMVRCEFYHPKHGIRYFDEVVTEISGDIAKLASGMNVLKKNAGKAYKTISSQLKYTKV